MAMFRTKPKTKERSRQDKVERLGRQLERLRPRFYAGFADVEAWLENGEPAPEPARVTAMLDGNRFRATDPDCYDLLVDVALLCAIRRFREEKGIVDEEALALPDVRAAAQLWIKEDAISQMWLIQAFTTTPKKKR